VVLREHGMSAMAPTLFGRQRLERVLTRGVLATRSKALQGFLDLSETSEIEEVLERGSISATGGLLYAAPCSPHIGACPGRAHVRSNTSPIGRVLSAAQGKLVRARLSPCPKLCHHNSCLPAGCAHWAIPLLGRTSNMEALRDRARSGAAGRGSSLPGLTMGCCVQRILGSSKWPSWQEP
jgi:hypothetical protein